jgi:hypothetical protein
MVKNRRITGVWCAALALTMAGCDATDSAGERATAIGAATASGLDPDVVVDALVQRLSPSYRVTEGTFEKADISSCFEPGGFCFGNNPSSPYQVPIVPQPDGSRGERYFTIARDEAVLLVGRTPPAVRYYGFSTYVYSRNGDQPEQIVFGSLYDTVNQTRIAREGADPFDAFTVFVITPNAYLQREIILPELARVGVPASMVNLQEIPERFPLELGHGPQADTFGMLVRTALPADPDALEAYVNGAPFRVLRVKFTGLGAYEAYDKRPYMPRGTGAPEPPSIETKLDQLVATVRAKYEIPGVRTSRVLVGDLMGGAIKTGHECIAGLKQCAGDNQDALYLRDTDHQFLTLGLSSHNFWIVVGVDHVRQNKATYVNHSVYLLRNLGGIVSFTDEQFAGSAAFHSGSDAFAELYAHRIARRCAGNRYCTEVPFPSADDPVGARLREPLFMANRLYLEPATGVGPLATSGPDNEIVRPRVIVFSPAR